MKKIVQKTFQKTVAFLPTEIELMPLCRWNESVFRYYFCRFLATGFPDVEQYVECDKFDLVLRHPPLFAFIEFKFYTHPRRFDPYDGSPRGFKGGPGAKNLREFKACIDKLAKRSANPGLSKYIILIYADPQSGRRGRYSHHYDEYCHSKDNVSLRLVESCRPIETTDSIIRAHLYGVV